MTTNNQQCCALKVKDGKRCCYKVCNSSDSFCKLHLRAKNIKRYDDKDVSDGVTHIVKSEPKIIDVGITPRLKVSNVRINDIKETLKYYGLPDKGKKQDIFTRLHLHLQTLYFYNEKISKILAIQAYYRNYLQLKLSRLQGIIVKHQEECVNQEDVRSLDPFIDIPSHLLFSFQDVDGKHYGFDIRTIRSIIQFDSENPYTRVPLSITVIDCADEMLRLLSLIGKDVSDEPVDVIDAGLQLKRRVVKVFHDMDQLDQYTNPEWFLNLSVLRLIKFYKEAEDVWNYRLNLTNEVKRSIVPPDGIAFKHSLKSVLIMKDKLQLQRVCLDFMEMLIHSTSNRGDRVNGCIYILLGLVQVSREAANALPQYYSMVTGDDSLATGTDILVF